MHRPIMLLAVAGLMAWTVPGYASNHGTKVEAVAMVKRVVTKFKTDGAEATFKSVTDRSNPEFHDRDLYPFIFDSEGVVVAHGARPALVGKNLGSLKDQDGNYLVREMIRAGQSEGGWIDYKWPHPHSNKIEDKTSYIEKMGDYFVGVGVYRR
jgi:signal transduction histidine kinase